MLMIVLVEQMMVMIRRIILWLFLVFYEMTLLPGNDCPRGPDDSDANRDFLPFVLFVDFCINEMTLVPP